MKAKLKNELPDDSQFLENLIGFPQEKKKRVIVVKKNWSRIKDSLEKRGMAVNGLEDVMRRIDTGNVCYCINNSRVNEDSTHRICQTNSCKFKFTAEECTSLLVKKYMLEVYLFASNYGYFDPSCFRVVPISFQKYLKNNALRINKEIRIRKEKPIIVNPFRRSDLGTEKTRIATLSDAHFNSYRMNKEKEWEKQHDRGAEELIKFIGFAIREGVSLLVLNGDILDVWCEKVSNTVTLPYLSKENNKRIGMLEKLFQVCDEVQRRQYLRIVYIRGNHDDRLKSLLIRHFFGRFTIVCDAMRFGDVWMEHGHRLDLFNSPVSKAFYNTLPLGYLITRINASTDGKLEEEECSPYAKLFLAILKRDPGVAKALVKSFLVDPKKSLATYLSPLMITYLIKRAEHYDIQNEIFRFTGKDDMSQKNVENGCAAFSMFVNDLRQKYPFDLLKGMIEGMIGNLFKPLEYCGGCNPDIGLVVFGHTHDLDSFKFKGKTYLNSGTWVNEDAFLITLGGNQMFEYYQHYGHFYEKKIKRDTIQSKSMQDVQFFKYVVIPGSKKNAWFLETFVEEMKTTEDLVSPPVILNKLPSDFFYMKNMDGLYNGIHYEGIGLERLGVGIMKDLKFENLDSHVDRNEYFEENEENEGEFLEEEEEEFEEKKKKMEEEDEF